MENSLVPRDWMPYTSKEGISNSFRKQMDTLFQTGQCSDLKLQFPDGQILRVHKAVVCKLSEVFRLACSGKFAEASTGIIKVSFEDTKAVLVMIHWMYTLEWRIRDRYCLFFGIRLYAVADFYQVRSLQGEVRRDIEFEVRLKLLRKRNSEDLPEAFEKIFSCVPECHRDLRNTIVEVCAHNLEDCFENQYFKDIRVPEFWADLALEVYDDLVNLDEETSDKHLNLMTRAPRYHEYECTELTCGNTFLVSESLEQSGRCNYCNGWLVELPLDVRRARWGWRKRKWKNRRR
ncbi:hypothetical protein IWZ01DRAFT_328855 [Phyllosticta capitalensis]